MTDTTDPRLQKLQKVATALEAFFKLRGSDVTFTAGKAMGADHYVLSFSVWSKVAEGHDPTHLTNQLVEETKRFLQNSGLPSTLIERTNIDRTNKKRKISADQGNALKIGASALDSLKILDEGRLIDSIDGIAPTASVSRGNFQKLTKAIDAANLQKH